jgi:hypothetical protein
MRRPFHFHRVPRPAMLALLATAWAASAAAAPARATVAIAIDRPLDGDILASPVTIAASATTDAANARVTGWQVYVDGVLAYGTGGPTAAITTSVPMEDGNREVIVRAWDSTGYYDSQSLTITIGICSGFTVDVQSPTAGSVDSPVPFAADASSCHRITGFAVYVDGRRVYEQPGDSSLDALLDLPAGHHSVLVRATDATRATASSDAVPIEVEPKPVAPPPPRPAQPKPVKPPPKPPLPS